MPGDAVLSSVWVHGACYLLNYKNDQIKILVTDRHYSKAKEVGSYGKKREGKERSNEEHSHLPPERLLPPTEV